MFPLDDASTDSEGEGDGDVVVAKSARASRAARPPIPKNQESVVQTVQKLEASMQALSLSPFAAKKQRYRYQSSSCGGRAETAGWRHLVQIHSKSIDSIFRDQQHIAFLAGHTPRHALLVKGGIRYSSVRVSLVYLKSLRLAGAKMGSSQQTTRVNVHPVCAAWAAQSIAIATTLGICNGTIDSDMPISKCDPRSSHALSPRQLLQTTEERFVVAATSRMVTHSLPTRLVASSLLSTMRDIATAELQEEIVSTMIRQPPSDALQSICRRCAQRDAATGDSIWASLALLTYLQAEPAGRRLLQTRSVSDVDAAVAATFLSYGRSEITRRSRLTDLQIADQERQMEAEKSKNRAQRSDQMAKLDAVIAGQLADALEQADIDAEGEGEALSAVLNAEAEPEVADEDDGSSTTTCSTVVLPRGPGRPPGNSVPPRRKEAKAATTLALRNDALNDEFRLILCQKRKRGVGGNAGVLTPSALALVYWSAALKSEHAHVLLMLLASSRSAAQRAADATVRSQVNEGELLVNTMLKQLSEENAVRSAVALRTTVAQSENEVPLMCAWREKGTTLRVGIARSSDDLSTCTIYAAQAGSLQPSVPIKLAWTNSYYHASPSIITAPHPAITESIAALERHKAKVANNPQGNVAIAVRDSGRIKESLRGVLTSTTISGIVRSFVTLGATLVVPESQFSAAICIQERFQKFASTVEDKYAEESGASLHEVLRPIHREFFGKEDVLEPFTTPGNNLGLALQVSETIRELARGKSHCGDPTKAFFGLQRPRELADSWSHDFDRPSALLPIIDVELEPMDPNLLSNGHDAPKLPSRPDARHTDMAVKLLLGGDCPVRIPEAVAKVAETRPWQARAMLLSAASTASLLGEMTPMACAGWLSTASAAAKRVLVADLNKRLLATPYQCHVVGYRNVRTSLSGTAWEGAYGGGLDLGSSGGVGLRCSALFADKR